MRKSRNAIEDGLEILDDDEPFIVQMKLLRRDLGRDQLSRRTFERNVKVWVAVIGVFSLLSAGAWWGTRADDQENERREERRDCLVRRDTRDGARMAILEAGVAGQEALITVTDSYDDPRAAALITETRSEIQTLLDRVLPTIACDLE